MARRHDLRGRTVVVTGAGSGIGRALALRMAGQGSPVAICDANADGLADTADGLGCFGPPERALAVMRAGGVGPFGVVSLVVVIGAQAAAFGALAGDRWWAIVLAVLAGRVAFTACCVRGVPPARPDGLGALVAGTQHVAVPLAWLAGLLVASVFVDRHHVWLGPVAILVTALLAAAFVAHVRRRLSGITGDVLGATCEVATTIVAATCTIG